MAMKLNTGKIAFPIEFDNGDKECIWFNPNDPGLSIRLKDFQEQMTAKFKTIENMQLNPDGFPDNDNLIEEFREVQTFIFEGLNCAFGNDICSVVFKHCSPFAITDGTYFILQFIEAVKPEIEKQIKKANAEVEKKMAKHLNKYAK